ncbi:hypothetical protein ACLKMH_04940 [Psychromonas sp. KJ10-10]
MLIISCANSKAQLVHLSLTLQIVLVTEFEGGSRIDIGMVEVIEA